MHQNTNENFTTQLILTCHHIYFTITPKPTKTPTEFQKEKICLCENWFTYSYGNRGVKTGQTLARTEKKQTANKSNFVQSTDAPNGNMKQEPNQRIFSQKTCSIIMLLLLAQ